MMRTVAIVQARMGSQRLPGKALKDLCGKPILQHVVERLRLARRLDEVVVAIPDAKKDDVLAEFCNKQGYSLFRGNEQDVLLRYWEAAGVFKADAVVRITADCPLIDPELVDVILERHASSKENDYTSNVVVRTFPRGVDTEVVSRKCLERLHREATDPFYREHVTNYVLDHEENFNIKNVLRPQGDRSNLRLCVDTQEDLDVVQAVVQHLESKDGTASARWSIENVIAFLDKHPQLAALNTHVQQKADRKSQA